jgi:hypothetical protein
MTNRWYMRKVLNTISSGQCKSNLHCDVTSYLLGWLLSKQLVYSLHMYEYGTLKPIEVILRRGWRKRENNGGEEPNQGTLYVHMEMAH